MTAGAAVTQSAKRIVTPAVGLTVFDGTRAVRPRRNRGHPLRNRQRGLRCGYQRTYPGGEQNERPARSALPQSPAPHVRCPAWQAGTLSGGTRQKLSLTLALMHDPPVLLLDEPYQGFDWQTYLAFWDLTSELRQRGTATVVISHLVFEQDRFDRICHLKDGRIDEEAGSDAAAV